MNLSLPVMPEVSAWRKKTLLKGVWTVTPERMTRSWRRTPPARTMMETAERMGRAADIVAAGGVV